MFATPSMPAFMPWDLKKKAKQTRIVGALRASVRQIYLGSIEFVLVTLQAVLMILQVSVCVGSTSKS